MVHAVSLTVGLCASEEVDPFMFNLQEATVDWMRAPEDRVEAEAEAR